MKSDEKVEKALESSQVFVIRAIAKGCKDTFPMGNDIGFTSLWCEKQNIKKYKEMLGQDKRKLRPELKELYQAI